MSVYKYLVYLHVQVRRKFVILNYEVFLVVCRSSCFSTRQHGKQCLFSLYMDVV